MKDDRGLQCHMHFILWLIMYWFDATNFIDKGTKMDAYRLKLR